GLKDLITILIENDREVGDKVSQLVEGEFPMFALPWVLTWFSHCVPQEDSERLMDALLVSPPKMVYYVCAAYILRHRDQVLFCDSDYSSLHVVMRAVSVSEDDLSWAARMCAKRERGILGSLFDSEVV